MPTPAHLPPRPTTLTHPHQLWPVLPAPGWGLRSSGQPPEHQHEEPELSPHEEARTRPRPAAVPARLGRRGPGWPAEGWAAERQRSAGRRAVESGGAPAGGEQPSGLPERGLGRGRGGGARRPGARPGVFPSPSQPRPSAPRELPRPLPRRGGEVAGGRRRGGQAGTLGLENPRRASATPTPHLSFCLLSLLHSLGESGGEKARRARSQEGTVGAPFLRPCYPTIHTDPFPPGFLTFWAVAQSCVGIWMPIPTSGVSPCSRGLN